MPFESVPFMAAVDLFVIGVAVYLFALYLRHRRATKRLGLSTGLGATLLGVAAIASIYTADFFAMFVLPGAIGPEAAMSTMRTLHLQWSWIAAVVSTFAFAYGLHRLVGGLVPRLATTIDELRATEDELRESHALLERRVAQRTTALAQSERQFRQFLDNSPDACHLKDADGRYLFASLTYASWLGTQVSSLVGARFAEVVDDPAVADWADTLDRRVLDGEPVVRETMDLAPRGQPARTIEVTKFPVSGQDGRVVYVGTISRDLTDAMRRERALEESEARYALAAEGSTSGIWDWDLDAGRIHFSARLRELLAFADERTEPRPRDVFEVIHPEDRDSYASALRAHLVGDTAVFRTEFRAIGDDGQVRWVVNRGIGQRGDDGRVHRMAGSVLDITDEVEQRRRAFESDRRLALALSHVPDGVALFDAEDRLVICNDTWRYGLNGAVADLLEPGVTFETYARALLEGRLVPEAVGREAAWMEKRLRTRRAGRNVVEIRMADDTWRLITETVVDDGSLVLVATPITDLKRREIALMESERRFRDLTEASSDWYWEMDADMRFTYLSPGLQESTGVSAIHFIGRRRDDVENLSSDPQAWSEHLADLDNHRAFRDFEYSVRFGVDDEHHFRVSGVALFDDDGRFKGYRGVGRDVTTLVVAERLRASAEARLSAAIASVDDAYAIFDADDRLVVFNEGYRALNRGGVGDRLDYGMSFTEIITAMVENRALVTGEDTAVRQAWLASRLDRHAEPSGEFVDVALDGDHWVQMVERKTSLGDTVLMTRDITTLKRQARSLQESEQRIAEVNRMLRLVLDTIPVRVFWKDRDGRYLGCNQAFASDVGEDHPDGVVGRDNSKLHWSASAEHYRQEDLEILASGEPMPVHETRRDDDAGARWYRVSKHPMRGIDGDIIGVLGIYEDITAEQSAERERDEARSQLEAAVEQSPAGIIMSAKAGRRLAVFNEAAVDMLVPGGSAPGDLRFFDEPPYPWTVLDADGREMPRDEVPLARALRFGEVSRNDELLVRFADGTEKWILVNAGPVRDADGGTSGAVVVFVDITEQRRAQAEVRRLNTELEARVDARTAALREALDDLESFSYSVSHDLRAPLRHVAGYIELLEREVGDSLDEKATRYLGVIHGAADRMGALIDDLLALSRTGRTAMKRAPVDLTELFREVRIELEVDPQRDIDWRIGVLPPVQGDRGLLRQVMANLIGNATKFSRDREPAIIEIGAEPDAERPGEVVYFVRDNGVGYDARYGDKLFGVFQRLHAHSEFEGTGIGLAIVHRIISRHGGRVWSTSEAGQGATFYFTVPAAGSEIR